MDAPFSTNQLYQLASRYNAYIEPLQILIYIPTLLIFVLLRRGTKQDTSRGVLLLLASEWAMVGVLFFFKIVADVHWVGYAMGGAFVATGLYYAGAASLAFPPHFHWRRDNPTLISFLIVAIATIGYPGLSWALGRTYPSVTTFGLMPGAVALLTLGVATRARPGPRLWLIVPPLIVALVMQVSVFWWRIWEDLALVGCGAIAFVAWRMWHGKNESAPTKDTIRFDF
jgi:hypothetical protein